jgi:hypothetical protein
MDSRRLALRVGVEVASIVVDRNSNRSFDQSLRYDCGSSVASRRHRRHRRRSSEKAEALLELVAVLAACVMRALVLLQVRTKRAYICLAGTAPRKPREQSGRTPRSVLIGVSLEITFASH